jgi:hypothetical protein
MIMKNIYYFNEDDDYWTSEYEESEEERNSNMIFSYYSLMNNNTIPDFTINKGVDVLTIKNIHPIHEKDLYQILEFNGFQAKSDHRIEDKRYKMKRTYINPFDTVTIEIFHDLTDYCKYQETLKIKIHDPHKEILDLLSSSLRYRGLDPQLYELELPFDFFSNDNVSLRGFLENHLIERNQKKDSFRYKDSYYTTDIRECWKGIRVYSQKFQNNRVRMELVLHRPIIRQLGLDLTLTNIDSVDFSKFFYFGTLRENDAIDFMVKKYGGEINQSNPRRNKHKGLVRRQLESYIGVKGFDKGTMMGKIEALKKTMEKNYNRFIEPHEEFNKKFFNLASGQKFLKSKAETSSLK